MSENDKNFQAFDFLRSLFSHFQPKTANILWKPNWIWVQSLLNVCWHSDSKTIQKVHNLHKNKVEIFRLLWSHSEVFLKQNTVMFSLKKYCIARFLLLSGLQNSEQNLSKNLQKLHQKRQKLRNFDISGQFEALFFYELNLSCNESSPKQPLCPRLKRLNTLVQRVFRYFDKKWRKKGIW